MKGRKMDHLRFYPGLFKTYAYCVFSLLILAACDDDTITQCVGRDAEGRVVKVLCNEDIKRKNCESLNTGVLDSLEWSYERHEVCLIPDPKPPVD